MPNHQRSRLTVRLAPEYTALVRAHAFVRNVSVNQLVQDMLALVVHLITDFRHPYFNPETLGFGKPDYPRELYPGYFASLGFGAKPQAATTAPVHNDASPLTEDDTMFIDVTPLDLHMPKNSAKKDED
jgi:hypothetical protein